MIGEKDMTIIGFIITWVAGIFGIGRAYGALATKVEKHDVDISKIKKEFRTIDGDQRLMSFAAHDKLQATCQNNINQRIDTMNGRLDKHDEKLDKILEAVQR